MKMMVIYEYTFMYAIQKWMHHSVVVFANFKRCAALDMWLSFYFGGQLAVAMLLFNELVRHMKYVSSNQHRNHFILTMFALFSGLSLYHACFYLND